VPVCLKTSNRIKKQEKEGGGGGGGKERRHNKSKTTENKRKQKQNKRKQVTKQQKSCGVCVPVCLKTVLPRKLKKNQLQLSPGHWVVLLAFLLVHYTTLFLIF
jgi:hypothetical protein